MVRNVLAVMGGLVAGSVFNMGIIMLSWMLYPPPEGASLSDPGIMTSYVQSLPLPAFLIVLIAHAGGAFVGGLVAALIVRRSALILGAIIGCFFLVGGIINVFWIPSPLWFAVADLVLYIPSGMLGAKVMTQRGSTE